MKPNDFVFFPGIVIETIGIIILAFGFLADSILIITIGAALLIAAIAVHITRIAQWSHTGPSGDNAVGAVTTVQGSHEQPGVLYADSLVTITPDSITFHHYSLLSGDRKVLFTDIDYIDVKKPTILTGKWRIAGSGSLTIWFPWDSGRPSRDRIFHATVKGKWMNIGFTVENGAAVTAILKKKGLVRSDELFAW